MCSTWQSQLLRDAETYRFAHQLRRAARLRAVAERRAGAEPPPRLVLRRRLVIGLPAEK